MAGDHGQVPPRLVHPKVERDLLPAPASAQTNSGRSSVRSPPPRLGTRCRAVERDVVGVVHGTGPFPQGGAITPVRMVGIAFSVCCCTPTALRNQVPSARRAKLRVLRLDACPHRRAATPPGTRRRRSSPPGPFPHRGVPSPAVKPTPTPTGGGSHQWEHRGDHHRGHRQKRNTERSDLLQ